jgi:hypothetical protein
MARKPKLTEVDGLKLGTIVRATEYRTGYGENVLPGEIGVVDCIDVTFDGIPFAMIAWEKGSYLEAREARHEIVAPKALIARKREACGRLQAFGVEIDRASRCFDWRACIDLAKKTKEEADDLAGLACLLERLAGLEVPAVRRAMEEAMGKKEGEPRV